MEIVASDHINFPGGTLPEIRPLPQTPAEVVADETRRAIERYAADPKLRRLIDGNTWGIIESAALEAVDASDAAIWELANYYDFDYRDGDELWESERQHSGLLTDRNTDWFYHYADLPLAAGMAADLAMIETRKEVAVRIMRMTYLLSVSPRQRAAAARQQDPRLTAAEGLTSYITMSSWQRLHPIDMSDDTA